MSPATTDAIRIVTYTLTSGETRSLYGWRTDNGYMLTDAPRDAEADGREYVVEQLVSDLDELRAIVDDYLAQTTHADVPPADTRRVYPDPSAVAA